MNPEAGEDQARRRAGARPKGSRPRATCGEAHAWLPIEAKQEPAWDLYSGMTIGEAALVEFFKRMRPGDPATIDNAREFLQEQIVDQRHYDLERVGRYKLNQKLDLTDKIPVTNRTITGWDIVALVRRLIQINNQQEDKDDCWFWI